MLSVPHLVNADTLGQLLVSPPPGRQTTSHHQSSKWPQPPRSTVAPPPAHKRCNAHARFSGKPCRARGIGRGGRVQAPRRQKQRLDDQGRQTPLNRDHLPLLGKALDERTQRRREAESLAQKLASTYWQIAAPTADGASITSLATSRRKIERDCGIARIGRLAEICKIGRDCVDFAGAE